MTNYELFPDKVSVGLLSDCSLFNGIGASLSIEKEVNPLSGVTLVLAKQPETDKFNSLLNQPLP